jgi:hypothetical protein
MSMAMVVPGIPQLPLRRAHPSKAQPAVNAEHVQTRGAIWMQVVT